MQVEKGLVNRVSLAKSSYRRGTIVGGARDADEHQAAANLRQHQVAECALV